MSCKHDHFQSCNTFLEVLLLNWIQYFDKSDCHKSPEHRRTHSRPQSYARPQGYWMDIVTFESGNADSALLRVVDSSLEGVIEVCRFLGTTVQDFHPMGRTGGVYSECNASRPFSPTSGTRKRETDSGITVPQVGYLHLPGFTRSWTGQLGPCITMSKALLSNCPLLLIIFTVTCHSQGKLN